jgi:L-seryl-tRNA(Ser) seleniumtransferase
MAETPYDGVGTRPIVNARGIYTDLGGSRLSPRVWAAMERANASFVEMPDLLDASGARIAEMIGAPAARVVPGASAGIVLSVAACIAGDDPDARDRLPDTTGRRNAIVIQHQQRYRWDRVVPLAGGRLIDVGDEGGTTAGQLSEMLDLAAAVLVPGHLDNALGTLPLAEVAALAGQRGVPVIVDAAYLNYPTARFGQLLTDGADLAIFSAKYFGGPNTGGFVCGRRDLVDTVAALDFTRHGTRNDRLAFGRPFKLDRQLVVGVVEALSEWLELDHGARFEGYERHVQRIAAGLRDLPGVTLRPMFFTMEEELEAEPVNCLVIDVEPAGELDAAGVEARLRTGNPGILVHQRDQRLIVDVEVIDDAEAELITKRLREELSRGG